MTDNTEREAVVAWLRADADQTEIEAARIIPKVLGLTVHDIGDWGRLIAMKRGIANAIERGDHLSNQEQGK